MRKSWLAGLSRRLKKALGRLYWKEWNIRCLRRRTIRFWIIRFNDWRNRKRKSIAIFWRNLDGKFRCSRNLRAFEFWVTKRMFWSWIYERTRLKWVRIKTGLLNYSITRISKCGRNTKIRNRHRNSRFTGNWWNMRLWMIFKY